jgi:hypothetical protein
MGSGSTARCGWIDGVRDDGGQLLEHPRGHRAILAEVLRAEARDP